MCAMLSEFNDIAGESPERNNIYQPWWDFSQIAGFMPKISSSVVSFLPFMDFQQTIIAALSNLCFVFSSLGDSCFYSAVLCSRLMCRWECWKEEC